jgi:hypothetical protein
MRVITKAVYQWSDERIKYVKIYDEGYEYNGPVELTCGSTQAQNSIQGSQMSFLNQAQSQASTVFGGASQAFNSLMTAFAPTVAAGPSQQGFSQQQLSNLNSQAITQTGAAYKNAKEAVGEAQSSVGGGNTSLPSGTQTGEDLGLAESAANQTSSQLSQITQAGYQQGNQNYNAAVAGELNAPNVFNAATSASNAATGAGSAAASTANQIATQNQSWVGAVTGLAGALGGAALTGGLSTLGGIGGSLGNMTGALEGQQFNELANTGTVSTGDTSGNGGLNFTL